MASAVLSRLASATLMQAIHVTVHRSGYLRRMLAWSILCVVTTLRVAGAVSCVDACAGCRSERRWELREVYCSMCQECRERRREWTHATSPLRLRAVSEINLHVPKKDECVPLCDRLGSGEVYKLQPIKRRESEQGEGEDTPAATTSTLPPTAPWPTSPAWDHFPQYPPIYSMAPGAATCVMCQNIPCPEKTTCPPPIQPDCPSTQKPDCPSTCHPNCPTTCQPSCPQNCPPACPPNCPTSCDPQYASTDYPPHQPPVGGVKKEPTYLYIGIPKGLEV